MLERATYNPPSGGLFFFKVGGILSINNTNRRNPTYFYKIGKPWSSLGVLSHAIERDQIHSSLITCQVFHGLPFILNIMVLKLLTATDI